MILCGNLLVLLDVRLVLSGVLITEVETEALQLVTLSASDMLIVCSEWIFSIM